MTIQNTDTFEVIVSKRIPYLTKFSGMVTALLFAFLFVALIVLVPAKRYPHADDIHYPGKLGFAFLVTLPVFIICFYVYSRMRIKRKAVLTFDTNKILLRGRGWSKAFPVNKIRYFDCYDYVQEHSAEETFTLEIKNWSGNSTMIDLKDYSQGNRLVDILTVYEEVKLKIVAEKPPGLSAMNNEL
jgi:hypothetical protein